MVVRTILFLLLLPFIVHFCYVMHRFFYRKKEHSKKTDAVLNSIAVKQCLHISTMILPILLLTSILQLPAPYRSVFGLAALWCLAIGMMQRYGSVYSYMNACWSAWSELTLYLLTSFTHLWSEVKQQSGR